MPELGEEGGERLYVDRSGHSTTIETDIGTVTVTLEDPKDNDFELANGTEFSDHGRPKQEMILWEQAKTPLLEYHAYYEERYGAE